MPLRRTTPLPPKHRQSRPEEESDGKPDIEIEIVDGDEETDEEDDEPETAGLED